MDLFVQIILLLLGFALLIKGADWFVDGSAGVAHKCNVSPLVIGLTVVAFGTSAPELCVSVVSAAQRSTDLAIGNVLGSNIVNALLILGVSALICALPVKKSTRALDLPVLMAVSAVFLLAGYLDGAIEWWDGLCMIVIYAGYMAALFLLVRRERSAPSPLLQGGALPKEEEKQDTAETEKGKKEGKIAAWFSAMEQKTWFLIILVAVGLAMVVGGGTLLVNAAKEIARSFGVTERIIGLTVVAIGTSLPELVTSVVAGIKKETDIAVGNVIGSNLFNILIVAGVSSLICPLAFDTLANLIDGLVALGAAVLVFVLSLFRGHKLGRVAGAVLLSVFVGYYIYLFVVPV